MSSESARRDDALARLRARGERVTAGRRAVIEVLASEGGHVDADTVAARVDAVEPGVHRATIYRSLQALVEAGVVTHTHVPGGATIYHLVEVASEHDDDGGHAHLQCVRCGGFTDIDAVEFAPLVARVRELTGFDVDAGHGALLGTCRSCGEKSAD